MNLLDFLPLILILIYGVLGYFTGVVRRVISLLSLFIACIAANGMGLQAGNLLAPTAGLEIPDARIWGFFGILFIVLVAIDGAAQLAHNQIQIEAIVWNRLSGVAVGVLTAILLSVIVVSELQAAGNPSGGGVLSGFQAKVHDAVKESRFAVPVVNAIGKPIIAVFQPVLPSDPHQYFSRGPVS